MYIIKRKIFQVLQSINLDPFSSSTSSTRTLPMKTLFLIRHGRPVFWNNHSYFEWVNGSVYNALISEFDEGSIDSDRLPHSPEIEESRGSDRFFCSDLRRAVDTARLFDRDDMTITPLLREAQIPPCIGLRCTLPLFVWMFLTRAWWYVGTPVACETYRQFRQRIRTAAFQLHEEIHNGGCNSITVIGHGFTNNYLRTELRRLGWTPVTGFRKNHWGVNRLWR